MAARAGSAWLRNSARRAVGSAAAWKRRSRSAESDDFMFQPTSGKVPIAFDAAQGMAENAGDFGEIEAAKKAQLHDAGVARIADGKFIEGAVDRENIDWIERTGCGRRLAVALGGIAAAGVIGEDLAHHAGGHGNEVSAAFPLDLPERGNAEIELVDHGGGLEDVAAGLGAEVAGGEAAQVLVNECGEFVQSAIGAFVPALQPEGDALWSGRRHKFCSFTKVLWGGVAGLGRVLRC